MKEGDIQVLIFAAREDPFDGWDRAKVLESELIVRGVAPQFVNRLSSNIDQLTLVAKHRILKSPAVLVMRKSKSIARYIGVPFADDVVKWMAGG